MEGRPVRRDADGIERRQAFRDGGPILCTIAQARQPKRVRSVDTLRAERGQQGLGADFEKGAVICRQASHAVGKAHRTAHMACPVIRVGSRLQNLAVEIADQRDRGRGEIEAGSGLAERLHNRVDEGRVERVGDREKPAAKARALQFLLNPRQGFAAP